MIRVRSTNIKSINMKSGYKDSTNSLISEMHWCFFFVSFWFLSLTVEIQAFHLKSETDKTIGKVRGGDWAFRCLFRRLSSSPLRWFSWSLTSWRFRFRSFSWFFLTACERLPREHNVLNVTSQMCDILRCLLIRWFACHSF